MKPRILIIRPAALGDTLMLMPAIVALRSSAEITFVGRSPGLSYLRPYVDLALDFEGPGWCGLFTEGVEHRDLLPGVRPDRVFAFLKDHEGRISVNLKGLFPGASIHLFPAFPPDKADIHVALYLAERLEEAGCPLDASKAFAGGFERALLGGEGPTGESRDVVLHPGSGGEKKNHPPQFWVEMAGALEEKGFRRTVILLGPAEERSFSFYEKHLGGQDDAEIILHPGMEKLLSILKEASLYVGHDSGITHLAAMLGTPTIALFKNSSVKQWRPIGPAVRVVEGHVAGPALLAETIDTALDLPGKTKWLYNTGEIQ